jgi:hypothetical protein
MKSPPTADALLASLPVWQRNLASVQSDQSLFSLLLEIETRLRAEARRDPLRQTRRRRSATRKSSKRLWLRIYPDTLNSVIGVHLIADRI